MDEPLYLTDPPSRGRADLPSIRPVEVMNTLGELERIAHPYSTSHRWDTAEAIKAVLHSRLKQMETVRQPEELIAIIEDALEHARLIMATRGPAPQAARDLLHEEREKYRQQRNCQSS